MKEGSLERLPEPVAGEAASSWRDSSSWSKDREGVEGEGEKGEEEEGGERGEEGEGEEGGGFDDRGEPEAAANTRGEEGGELGVCLVGRWAAEDFLGPWLEEALFLGGALPGSEAGAEAARRPRRFWLRWSSWHWAPRGQVPLREKSGHSSVCFFLHFAPSGQ